MKSYVVFKPPWLPASSTFILQLRSEQNNITSFWPSQPVSTSGLTKLAQTAPFAFRSRSPSYRLLVAPPNHVWRPKLLLRMVAGFLHKSQPTNQVRCPKRLTQEQRLSPSTFHSATRARSPASAAVELRPLPEFGQGFQPISDQLLRSPSPANLRSELLHDQEANKDFCCFFPTTPQNRCFRPMPSPRGLPREPPIEALGCCRSHLLLHSRKNRPLA
ncbi:hypothetical protein MA16_Dca020416 [Dendrobium catenatum]|uniref:Uncharacterized protein n=1 Tax=Dendrobium catenatum TaxID=906689 RepID=A0A2I0VB55_9ASPA|nr:hypothetical protein MA16_Dca020416 [Dendrobium catenatum]